MDDPVLRKQFSASLPEIRLWLGFSQEIPRFFQAQETIPHVHPESFAGVYCRGPRNLIYRELVRNTPDDYRTCPVSEGVAGGSPAGWSTT